ncbi:hypothetical protein HS041_05245 [Planomonospora sp. ID67723]|uniref:hypothetical protein n=1 Tax=Planomonospora sp. ID67723 TaxID=2738134 RepID=UPI0018C362BB|nr:hypothetical protein [Planomonospora sp. ID67723]MBG0827165.1 hypothetical protein [Planomonospora sp. ID67723]
MEQDRSERWRRLPQRITFDQMTTAQPAGEARDPEMGRDADQEFMLRYAAG